ncbi:hypothetical protein [Lacinutrix sp. Hel_I_90]|uniref:hypothetical protein n=1 Tax=Lacinutrix sp. Hel_I_90 TaxID=1249999 RepID=UPI0005CB1486|nr:hypothetical protein [Lacinutrix sp. Hel_I_90]
MEISIYKSSYTPIDSIENFWDVYYSMQMHYLASDLLDYGLSPKQISKAVLKAIKAAKSSGLEIRRHFMPVFSQRNHDVINDCKLTKMGYGLVLLNADVALSLVGQLQVSIMKSFLK